MKNRKVELIKKLPRPIRFFLYCLSLGICFPFIFIGDWFINMSPIETLLETIENYQRDWKHCFNYKFFE